MDSDSEAPVLSATCVVSASEVGVCSTDVVSETAKDSPLLELVVRERIGKRSVNGKREDDGRHRPAMAVDPKSENITKDFISGLRTKERLDMRRLTIEVSFN